MSVDTGLNGKLMSAKEAVSRFIMDGSQIALGGFTVNRNPMCIAREIIRQQKKDLHLVLHSHGQAMDLMIGAGCVSKAELAYGGTGRFAPTGIRFRKAVTKGELLIEDYSNMQMSLRFLAGSLGLPFIPSKSGFGSDVVNKDRFGSELRGKGKVALKKNIVTDNPFSDAKEPVVLLPALNPDVALVHAQYVGDDGTVRIKGLTFLDIEQARSADILIVSFEEMVPSSFMREDPDQNCMAAFMVDAFVHAPYGAHPTATHYFYDYDPGHLNLYRKMAPDDKTFQEYLDKWVYGPGTQEEYLGLMSAGELNRIRANSKIGYAKGLDRR